MRHETLVKFSLHELMRGADEVYKIANEEFLSDFLQSEGRIQGEYINSSVVEELFPDSITEDGEIYLLAVGQINFKGE